MILLILTFGVWFVYAQNPCDSMTEFSNEISATVGGDSVSVRWTIDCAAKSIQFTLTGQTNGWLAIGFNDKQQMSGTDCYQVSFNGAASVRNSHAEGYTLRTDTPSSVTGTPSGSATGNEITVSFQRTWSAASANDVEFEYGTPFYFVFARRNGSPSFDSQHDSPPVFTKAPVELFSATQLPPNETVADDRSVILIHGFLMIVAWSVCAMVSSYIARFLKGIGHIWFITHRAIGFVIIALEFVAFFFAIGNISANDSTHFDHGHEIVGLLIILISIAQPVLGVIADKKWTADRTGTPVFPDIVHWGLGYLLIFLGFINIILGFDLLIGGPSPGLAVFLVWVFLFIAFMAVSQWKLGSAVHNSDADKNESLLAMFRHATLALFGLGVLFAIIAVAVDA